MKPSAQAICNAMKQTVDTSKLHPVHRIYHAEIVKPLVEELEEIDQEHTRYYAAIVQALNALISNRNDDAVALLRGALP